MQETIPQNIQQGAEWVKILPALLGTLIGGLITIAAIWIKEAFEKRRKVQEWFEKTYIEEGVDPLLAFHGSILMYIAVRDESLAKELRQTITIPTEALARIHMLMGYQNGTGDLILLSHFLGELIPRSSVKEYKLGTLEDVGNYLRVLRRILLDVRVKSKSDVHKLSTHRELVELNRLYKNSGEGLKNGQTETTIRPPSIRTE